MNGERMWASTVIIRCMRDMSTESKVLLTAVGAAVSAPKPSPVGACAAINSASVAVQQCSQ
jgi:hypothetical protein